MCVHRMAACTWYVFSGRERRSLLPVFLLPSERLGANAIEGATPSRARAARSRVEHGVDDAIEIGRRQLLVNGQGDRPRPTGANRRKPVFWYRGVERAPERRADHPPRPQLAERRLGIVGFDREDER